jgi:NADPH:quinone reductase-like Zn-dependent oxidoreductase
MRNMQIRVTGLGGVEHLVACDGEIPRPGQGELLIRIEFAGVGFADLMIRHGKLPGTPRLPVVPGYDIVGIVERADPQANIAVGTRVAALTRFGGYAQYVVVKANGVAIVPREILPEKAVCMVLNYLTAYQMLTRTAGARRGDSVLVHGAAGGVGTAALQLGMDMGLRLFGTASVKKHDLVRALGATPMDYREASFVSEIKQLVPEGISMALDPVGPASWNQSKRVIKHGGMLIGYGGLGTFNRETDHFEGSDLSLLAGVLRQKLFPTGIRFRFFSVSVRRPERTKEDLGAVFDLAARGRIDPIISDVLPLGAAAEAHRRLAAGHVRGKIVLDCR